MATMNISVPGPMRDWVQNQVEGRRYASASDYVRDLIRRDQEMGENDPRWQAYINREIELGLADKAAGRVLDADVVSDQLQARYAAPAQR